MKRLPRDLEIPAVLGALCLILALVLLTEWRAKVWIQDRLRATVEEQARSASPSALSPEDARGFALASQDRFAVMVDRPLFFQGRTPPVAVAVEDPDKPFEAALHGVIKSPAGTLVLLRESDGKYHRLQQGETLLGWELSEIHPDRVIMTLGDERRELVLLKPKPKDPVADTTDATRKDSGENSGPDPDSEDPDGQEDSNE